MEFITTDYASSGNTGNVEHDPLQSMAANQFGTHTSYDKMTTLSTPRKKKLKACLIVDSESIARWQYLALELSLRTQITICGVIYCQNTFSKRRSIRHSFYYLLSLASIRNRWTKAVNWNTLLSPSTPVHEFHAETIGSWQLIPDETKSIMASWTPDVVIKFGMNLLRDPDSLAVKYGVISFHHGDPATNRGRPAGFYELLHLHLHAGIIVQKISNKLDAGEILAFGQFRLSYHSYRRTLEHMFEHGAPLLSKALQNVRDNIKIDKETDGINYRLPSNFTVVRFCLCIIGRKVKRLLYGTLYRKNWSVGLISNTLAELITPDSELTLTKSIPTPAGYEFIADPFLASDGNVVCEGSPRRSGRGGLIVMSDDNISIIDTHMLGSLGHVSFPCLFDFKGVTYLLPEMSSIGSQRIASLNDRFQIMTSQILSGIENERLIDPILRFENDRWWLFAGKLGSEHDALYLWSSDEMLGPFRPHPNNPVVMSPYGARNAGLIFEVGGHLYRPGQNNCESYGNGIVLSRIDQLNDTNYNEISVAHLHFTDRHGPHTLTSNSDVTVVDFYVNVFSALAWLTRFRSLRLLKQ